MRNHSIGNRTFNPLVRGPNPLRPTINSGVIPILSSCIPPQIALKRTKRVRRKRAATEWWVSKKWVIRKCEWCGNEFEARTAETNRGWGILCSKECSMKYLNSIKPKPESKNRLNFIAREIYIRRYGEPVCEECGKSPADVHHRDENVRNNRKKNHFALCRGCHTAHHNHANPKRKAA